MLRVVAVLTFALLLVPGVALANKVQLTDITVGDFAINGGNGGAFLATTKDDGDLANNTSFLTFCLEITQTFNLGGTYNYVLNDRAVSGGGNSQPNDILNPGDIVSDATKWLYYQAISGGYQTLAPLVGNLAQSGAYIQKAIWVLEDEIALSSVNAQIQALVGIANSNAFAWGGLQADGHQVYAMNLTDNSGSQKQDQLAYLKVSVPELGTVAYVAPAIPILAIYLAVVFLGVSRRQ
jgi:hypothetical protein